MGADFSFPAAQLDHQTRSFPESPSVRPEKLDEVKDALARAGFIGLSVTHVTGRGVQKGVIHTGRGGEPYTIDRHAAQGEAGDGGAKRRR